MAQIKQGMKDIYTDEDMKEREEAFRHLEKMKRKVPDLDYDRELAAYREEQYKKEIQFRQRPEVNFETDVCQKTA